jgi:hypothetical protein
MPKSVESLISFTDCSCQSALARIRKAKNKKVGIKGSQFNSNPLELSRIKNIGRFHNLHKNTQLPARQALEYYKKPRRVRCRCGMKVIYLAKR